MKVRASVKPICEKCKISSNGMVLSVSFARTRATSSVKDKRNGTYCRCDLPRRKQTWIALTYIYGIGQTTAKQICAQAQVDATQKIDQLTDQEVVRLRQTITDGIASRVIFDEMSH